MPDYGNTMVVGVFCTFWCLGRAFSFTLKAPLRAVKSFTYIYSELQNISQIPIIYCIEYIYYEVYMSHNAPKMHTSNLKTLCFHSRTYSNVPANKGLFQICQNLGSSAKASKCAQELVFTKGILSVPICGSNLAEPENHCQSFKMCSGACFQRTNLGCVDFVSNLTRPGVICRSFKM